MGDCHFSYITKLTQKIHYLQSGKKMVKAQQLQQIVVWVFLFVVILTNAKAKTLITNERGMFEAFVLSSSIVYTYII
jgi:hypothetical protein